jgi:glycogen phosphorylase
VEKPIPIYKASERLRNDVKIVYLENYGMELALLMTSGVDLWLNTPMPPLEASGTSGMKAALNGVPSFSILDGWWIEGHIEGVTGWAIGELGGPDPFNRRQEGIDELRLYDKLEKEIIPIFYGRRERFIEIMRSAIALNGSFFNTQRMLKQYVVRAYLPQ